MVVKEMESKIIEERFQSIKDQLRDEVNLGLSIWKDIFQNDFTDEVVYVYAKGSAVKKWDTAIDYVPILSDVDIHIKAKNLSLFQEKLTLEKAFTLSEKYKQTFERKQSKKSDTNSSPPVHLPRFQIMTENQLFEDPKIILPRKEDIKLIFGEVEFPKNDISDDFIRKVDLERLIEDYAFVNSLASAVFDRSASYEFWTVLRRMNWRVSPTPVRLLTQIIDANPLDVWTWNRTTIIKELISQGFSEIAENYKNYYLTGWKLFNTDFKDLTLFKQAIIYGNSLLTNCYHVAIQLKQDTDESLSDT
ncbi:MAG: hypothetical protein KAR35_02465 [Candidatus Heimdallarchaeota archaeon]|nr:hypothetical protein [Candidatus Heimdallarchaeota archaeon]MCK5048218.1 hypothetical protein [Candidatus Heimdallarchaeota archaeon]